jgi:hypothetical protein
MQTVTAIHSSGVEPAQLSAVMADYFALEQARIYRRLLVSRFSVLALVLGIVGLGFRLLTPFASWFSVGMCAVAPTWAWIAEFRCDRRLSRRLNDLPDGAMQVSQPPV